MELTRQTSPLRQFLPLASSSHPTNCPAARVRSIPKSWGFPGFDIDSDNESSPSPSSVSVAAAPLQNATPGYIAYRRLLEEWDTATREERLDLLVAIKETHPAFAQVMSARLNQSTEDFSVRICSAPVVFAMLTIVC
jgi:hypothetical protein